MERRARSASDSPSATRSSAAAVVEHELLVERVADAAATAAVDLASTIIGLICTPQSCTTT